MAILVVDSTTFGRPARKSDLGAHKTPSASRDEFGAVRAIFPPCHTQAFAQSLRDLSQIPAPNCSRGAGWPMVSHETQRSLKS